MRLTLLVNCMSRNDFVSVIMATYNGGSRLKDAIQSILDQSYSNFELVIINDASKNPTTKTILDSLIAHPKVKIIENKSNLGLAESLNIAIQHSAGELLVRMDDDDFSHQNRIEVLVKAMKEKNYPAVIGSFSSVTDGDKNVGVIKVPINPNIIDILRSKAVVHPTTILNRSIIQKIGGYRSVPQTLRLEDIDLWCRIIEAGEKILNIPYSLLDYYESRSSVSKRSASFRLRELKLKIYWRRRLSLSFLFNFLFIIKFLMYIIVPKSLYLSYRHWRFN